MLSLKVGSYFVNFKHTHFDYPITLENGKPIKAFTQCELYVPEDQVNPVAIGQSYCSVLDKFTKPKGRQIALKFALNELGLAKAEREVIWRDYLRQCRRPTT